MNKHNTNYPNCKEGSGSGSLRRRKKSDTLKEL